LHDALPICPFFTRFASIGRPIAPVPTNAIFIGESPLFIAEPRPAGPQPRDGLRRAPPCSSPRLGRRGPSPATACGAHHLRRCAACSMSARTRSDRDVRRARQAPASAGGLALIALAAVSWGTSGSVVTVLAARAAAG